MVDDLLEKHMADYKVVSTNVAHFTFHVINMDLIFSAILHDNLQKIICFPIS